MALNVILKRGFALEAAASTKIFPDSSVSSPYLQRAGQELKAICSHDRPVMPGVEVALLTTAQVPGADELESAALV